MRGRESKNNSPAPAPLSAIRIAAFFSICPRRRCSAYLFTAAGRPHAAHDRIGGAYHKRRNARDDGLLRARDEHIGHLGAPGGSPSVAARLSTWERLPWRRRCAAPRTSRHDRKSERQNVCTTNCPHCLTG